LKVIILAGGMGTRISEESQVRPKPMVEIGEKPILWHIMKLYSYYGYNDFIICCGYKGHMIKEYFANYYMQTSDLTFDFSDGNRRIIHNNIAEPWKVTLVDTGYANMTGSRIKQVQKYVPEGETFLCTYGDGLADIDINSLVDFHRKHGYIATVTAIQPGGRFGVMNIQDDMRVRSFVEKPKEDGNWISGGFFVFNYGVFNYIPEGNNVVFEQESMPRLAEEGELVAYKHRGFWQAMDTLRDKNLLDRLWNMGTAPWKVW